MKGGPMPRIPALPNPKAVIVLADTLLRGCEPLLMAGSDAAGYCENRPQPAFSMPRRN